MTAPNKSSLERRRAELTKRWHRQAAIMEQATARLAEAYNQIERLKTLIKAIDYDLDNMVDNQWNRVSNAHEVVHEHEDSMR